VLLGLLAFLSLNPYLITIFAFAQVLIVIGVILFLIALIRPAPDIEGPGHDKATADSD